MSEGYIVYGQKGTGSVPIEAALTLLGEPYRVIERVPEERPGEGNMSAHEMAARINPMWQVPALRLPSGELMTESAAILIYLADSHPGRLGPGPGDPLRPKFLRWMAFIATQIYALVWIRDDPSRLVDDPQLQQVAMARTRDRIAHCWGIMNDDVEPGRFLLGDEISVLDLYVAMISHWGPRREVFRQRAPKMWPCVERVDAEPRLREIWGTRLG